MLEVLSVLIRLQEVDNNLKELDEEKGDLPEQLERLSGEVKNLNTTIQEKEIVINRLKDEVKEVTRDLAEAEKRSERSQSVIFNVKTTREYDAISSEIEQAKQTIVENELKKLELEVSLEGLKKELVPLLENAKTVEKEYKSRQKEMQGKLDASHDETTELQNLRSELVGKLQRPVLAHYERIRKIRDGVGVAFMTGDACNYCYSVLPPQRQAEVKKMSELLLCEVCGCILVSEESAPNLVSSF